MRLLRTRILNAKKGDGSLFGRLESEGSPDNLLSHEEGRKLFRSEVVGLKEHRSSFIGSNEHFVILNRHRDIRLRLSSPNNTPPKPGIERRGTCARTISKELLAAVRLACLDPEDLGIDGAGRKKTPQ